MSKLFCKQFIMLGILFIFGCTGMFSRSFDPDKRTIDTTVCVIDTLCADDVYSNIVPTLIGRLNALKNKRSICENLVLSNKKKVESANESQILQEAFDLAQETGTINEARSKKNIREGKLTDDVKTFLSLYAGQLGKTIDSLEYTMENDWLSFVDNPPTKLVVIQIENPYYRGLHYDDQYLLDKIDKSIMTEGFEFLYPEGGYDGLFKKELYPVELYYLQFPEKPHLRVTYNANKDDIIREVYDEKGSLVFVPYLDRSANNVFYEFKRIVYYRDYKNNKYNIKSEKHNTQEYLNLYLGRKNGFEKTDNEIRAIEGARNVALVGRMLGASRRSVKMLESAVRDKENVYRDSKGSKFIDQLELDHSNDFGYIYSIERMGDKQFRVVYLNKETLKPSICGIVTFETGDAPYTSTYSVKLCELPDDVPPAIRH